MPTRTAARIGVWVAVIAGAIVFLMLVIADVARKRDLRASLDTLERVLATRSRPPTVEWPVSTRISDGIVLTNRYLLHLAPTVRCDNCTTPWMRSTDAPVIRLAVASMFSGGGLDPNFLQPDPRVAHDYLLGAKGLFDIEMVGKKFRLHARDGSRVRCAEQVAMARP